MPTTLSNGLASTCDAKFFKAVEDNSAAFLLRKDTKRERELTRARALRIWRREVCTKLMNLFKGKQEIYKGILNN